MNLNENKMFKTFKTKDFQISHYFLNKLKVKLNFRRRINCKEQRLQIEHAIKKMLKLKLKNEIIQKYDKNKLYDYFRNKKNMFVKYIDLLILYMKIE